MFQQKQLKKRIKGSAPFGVDVPGTLLDVDVLCFFCQAHLKRTRICTARYEDIDVGVTHNSTILENSRVFL